MLSKARDVGHEVEIGVENGQVIVFVDGKSIAYTSLVDDLVLRRRSMPEAKKAWILV